jgi:predicted RNase H-like HicB family nuclease
MKLGDRYLKWIEWSEEDSTYLGKCPDLITGIHGDDPVQLYAELEGVVNDVLEHLASEGRPLPEARVRPMREVA